MIISYKGPSYDMDLENAIVLVLRAGKSWPWGGCWYADRGGYEMEVTESKEKRKK
jgi:hypothetical protein